MSNQTVLQPYQRLLVSGTACLLIGFMLGAILFLAPPANWSVLQTSNVFTPGSVTAGLAILISLFFGMSIVFNLRGLLLYRHQK